MIKSDSAKLLLLASALSSPAVISSSEKLSGKFFTSYLEKVTGNSEALAQSGLPCPPPNGHNWCKAVWTMSIG